MKLINNTINFPKYLIKKFEKVNTLEKAIEVYAKNIEHSDMWNRLKWGFVNNEFQMFDYNNRWVTFQIENK